MKNESPELRALCTDLPMCIACLYALRGNVFCILMCFRGYMSDRFRCSRANIPCVITFSCKKVLCVLTSSRGNVATCLLAYEPTCLVCLCTYAHKDLACLCAQLPMWIACLRACVPCMSTKNSLAITKISSMTCFIWIFGTLSLFFHEN